MRYLLFGLSHNGMFFVAFVVFVFPMVFRMVFAVFVFFVVFVVFGLESSLKSWFFIIFFRLFPSLHKDRVLWEKEKIKSFILSPLSGCEMRDLTF
jgi:hypothetical protein